MKKLLLLLTLSALTVGMTACGRGDEGANQTTEQNTTAQTEETQTSEVEETQGATEETTPATEEVSDGMDAATGWSEEMTAIRQAVVDVMGENYWPDMQIPADMLEMNYGITADMYDDYMAEMPMMGTHVDTLLIIKAKDDKVEAVEDALNAYRDMLVADTFQYPMNLGKIQASRIQRYGNYVCFVQLGADNLADENMTEEESITKCQEQNELALEVIGKAVPN
uniref:DUF4358 domain-containing protein n=1 Tax=Acetatifactor sp. TaxID=1872090 RepID=UPI00405667EC